MTRYDTGAISRTRSPINAKLLSYKPLRPSVASNEGYQDLSLLENLRQNETSEPKRLGIYFPGFGWHQFRRQAITALGELDPMQAQRLAGHSKPDMTALYTLDDAKRQDRIIRASQEQLMGVVPIRKGA